MVADGVAAEHPFSARIDAARKLIGNHEKVSLHTTPSPPPPPLSRHPPHQRLAITLVTAHTHTLPVPVELPS